ncbi:MAG: hypothetical protein OEW19_11595, partial [Acidobacteriota bacterium]|nr:hypothetical protein [Acidobacteriota bacterium]
ARLEDMLRAKRIQALIVDVSLVPRDADVSGLVRRLGNNRPLVLLGDTSGLPGSRLDELSVVPRPITRESLLLSVGLALAEGRPARRYARKPIEPLAASAHGIAVTVREASTGGVGIELPTARSNALPSVFSLRIPDFGVHVAVRRAWLAPVSPETLRCGGTVEGDFPDAARPWSEFAREAPTPIPPLPRRR